MNQPPLEVADLIRVAGQRFVERSRQWLTGQHLKVLAAIERCRTATLGGHLDECSRCGHRAISYNSCRNRHCPKCQANARDRWIEARRKELLPTPYVHVVFTLPHLLAPLALRNKKVVYDLLFRTSAATLLAVARNPKHLGADIGFFSVLHTWNQKLEHHPHVHCVVPAGGNHAMNMRMMLQFLIPSMEHAEEADVGAEMFGIASDCEERCRAGAEQKIVDDLLVAQGQGRQQVREREDDVNIGRGQQFFTARLDPTVAGVGLTLRTVPVAARVVRDGAIPAAGTLIQMPAESSRAATFDGCQDLA